MTGEAIEVPWRVLPDYQCFGCSPANEHGLRLTFTRTDDGIECALKFDRAFESYPGVVHGGMSTTVCDEIMGNLLVLRTGFSVFTTSLRTRYVAPLAIGTAYRCVATTEVSAGDTGPFQAHAQILDADGQPIVFATGGYQPMTASQARSRMDLSDADAALIEQALADLRTAD
ncbi:PaaI family thioesterase [Actinokineospora sp.]|uniref:PaaI family thioesterase n=1 Tax=Actinokineospora sp. TaxID=1872133 RepID=UPI00403764B7